MSTRIGTSLPAARSIRVVSSPSSRGIITSMITASAGGGQPGQRLNAVLGRADLVAVVLQGPLQGVAYGLIIVDDQDVHPSSVPDAAP